jgi:DNA mismatch repair protein MutS
VDADLDELREISHGGKATIASIEERERERTGIGSLKVRFNRVFGYYIEVSKSNLALVPTDYVRKQTIVGGERFVTPELKDYEEKVLRAEERILLREADIFESLRGRVASGGRRIQQSARAVAILDVLASLAEASCRYNYVKPRISPGDELHYVDGRHPVMERVLPEPFVANDLGMGDGQARVFILTGPNMGGKSTFLRQTALVVVLAQMGCFVPAKQAKVGLVDRIFTRVGASDQILRGQSTFMVEMQETAHILRHATDRSLILLDEIGRGTATFDGLSIAWAVAEHLARRTTAKTLFATHYHELTDLAADLPGVGNLHVSAREWKDTVVFLRKIEPGGSDRSFGIQVARLAGLPAPVVLRAQEILRNLERTEFDREGRPRLARSEEEPPAFAGRQLSLFGSREDSALEELRRINLDSTSPLEALAFLAELKKRL